MSDSEEWARRRRAGESVRAIARSAGVSHQWVSRETALWGPFRRAGSPPAAVVAEWVEQRRAGRSVARVARDAGVSEVRVAGETRPFGPFPRRLAEPGWMTQTDVSRAAGVSLPVVMRWIELGMVPVPDRVVEARRLWRSSTITGWLESAEVLEQCPACGARALSVSRHQGAGGCPGRGRVMP